MNSLTYLSRQFDVLASPATPRAPPPTPTSAHATLHVAPDGDEDHPHDAQDRPGLKRVQTWSTRSVLASSQGPARTRSRKRSHSTPGNPRTLTHNASTRKTLSLAPSMGLVEPFPASNGVFEQLYVVRVFVALYSWLCAAWASLTQTQDREDEAETSADDEKDSDEEGKQAGLSFTPLDSKTAAPSHPRPPVAPTTSSSTPRWSIFHSVEAGLKPPEKEPLQPSGGFLLPNPLPNNLFTSSTTHPPTEVLPPASTPPAGPTRKTPFHLPKTLVLDLDETLIHSTTRPLYPSSGSGLLGLGGFGLGKKGRGACHTVEVVLGGRSTLYHVYKRPFVDYFLRKVSGWYTLVIFTASMQEYADPVIDWLDAGRGILVRRLFRELPNGSYTKDLSIIEQDLARVCLVDNSPVSYSINQANGIPIEGWTHDPADEALLDLLPVLDSLRFTSDVRRVLGIRGFS